MSGSYSGVLKASQGPSEKHLYLESYGCQMNFSDSEIVASVMAEIGYGVTDELEKADVVMINTCSIRENAEQKVRARLQHFRSMKRQKPSLVIGVLGCMAERLKSKLLDQEQLVDLVVGPDAYKDLPGLLEQVQGGQQAVNVLLSREETYADIAPVRLGTNGVSAFVTIMRGCDNMCSFCVVPFTRGRERSRDPQSIVAECTELWQNGYREVTLLGQNVDSYRWITPDHAMSSPDLPKTEVRFADLLGQVAAIAPDLRVRFSTSHPKDITDEVLYTMAAYPNLCKNIHLPVQSGNSAVLSRMNRTYDRAWYLERVEAIRRILPDCAITTDVISGFCGETEAEHQDTLSLMEAVRFDSAYMFAYSERPGTLAARKYPDDVPEETKKRRLAEIMTLQDLHSIERNQDEEGQVQEILVEGYSKKSKDDFCGRNSRNKMVVFGAVEGVEFGQTVHVRILRSNKATLMGECLVAKEVVL
jgi:tRNA-2-methylthio-N6-dimethylallyladenosine synthase